MLLAAVEYMTTQTILRHDSNQLKNEKKKHKNLVVTPHVGPWVSIKSTAYSRLTDIEWLTEFCCFSNRFCDFERFIEKLNRAITKLGRFSI